MKSQKIKYIIAACFVAVCLTFVYYQLNSDGKGSFSQDDRIEINPEFAAYISSFTSGHVSSNATIRIKFTSEFSNATLLNTPLEEEYFDFDPAIKGKAVWKDAQTMEFIPDERLPSAQTYKATFYLHKLTDVKKQLKNFEFQFQTVEQSVQLELGDLKCYNSNDFLFYSLSGTVSTADYAESSSLEKILIAKYNQKMPAIKWSHDASNTIHKFVIDSVKRLDGREGKLEINCDASSLKVDYKSQLNFPVPEKGKFQLLNTKVLTEGEPYILLNFSNPIDQNRALEGLISLVGVSEVKYIVTTNQVAVYPAKVKSGTYTLRVDAGVEDTRGQKLGQTTEHAIVLSQVKPSIRFVGDGNILPSTSGLHLSFEAVNLRAVDVKVVKIYENNVLQFLQSNSYDGASQLSQVGKKVIQKKINLGISNPAEYGFWKKFSLDLSTLIQAEPGAIYRITLSAKKAYSTYPCVGTNNSENTESVELTVNDEEEEPNYFGYYDEDNSYYYDYEYEDYNWDDRDNPCKSYYYRRSERIVSRNILASDLGITLKKGNDGSLFFVANDLISTKPLSDVTIELYDYQKQQFQTEKTNSDGQVIINPIERPWFVVARKNKMVTYLRVDDGATLPLSMYDVSGETIKKGIKGFIYGERGVWRPGDTLFLNFILEDKNATLPSNHPVTFELFNPQGQLYKRLVSNKSTNGFYNFTTVTDKDALTGIWKASVKVGSNKFQKNVRIEAIMPNRLKIDIKAGDGKMITAAKDKTINLHVNWLTGALAKNLNTKIGVTLSSAPTEFENFKDFKFEDKASRFETQIISLFDGKIDEQGNAAIPLNIAFENSAPGFLKATFNTSVFEPGGAFSVDRFSNTYSPFQYYVGLKLPKGEKNSGILYTNRDQFIEIATVDENGKPVSRGNLKFELYKLQWRWWWDQYEYELANYANDDYHKPIQKEIISSKNGVAKVKVNIEDRAWGRYLVRVTDLDGGHASSIVTYFDWSNWMDRDGGADNRIVSNMLNFSTDKVSYKTGEEVKVTIPSPNNGRILVTIENGSRVLEAHWVEAAQASTVFKFKVTPEMAPNIYLNVSLLQPHSRTNDLPIRMYGVVPVLIDDPETHLSPVITMPKVIEPEKKVTIQVNELNGKEMAFTLAVVEEGLLDITRFKTPNPHPAFYAKEALGVKTWDIYDQVIGAYGSDLERILSIGGDGSELNNDGAKANRFKPMIRFFGPFLLSKNDKKEVTFTMPMYVGAVRTMVIAGNKGSYGFAEQSTKVKAPLMILGTLPRILSVTEEVKLPVSVFGGDKNIGATTVKVEMNGLLQAVGSNVQTINVGKDDEQLVTFDLKVKNKTGIAKVKITATGAGHTASYEIELDVRNPNPYQTQVTDFTVDAGQTLNDKYNATGVGGTNSGVLEISSLPPINLEERLNYLIGYPHGCVEQTTSQSFAQLYITDIVELPLIRKNEIEDNIKAGINRLGKFQLSNGGMSYWQGGYDANDWGTSYAGHFMILAEKKGFMLPPEFKRNWINYQQSAARNFEMNDNKNYSNDERQAYRLYSLALANAPVIAAMNRLREYSKLSNQAKWMLAAAYAQIGQINEAEKLIQKTPVNVPLYRVNYYTYGSSDRDLAIVLQTLCLMNKKQEAFSQLKKVAEFLSSNKWLSTQTTAFGLVSVADFVKKFGGTSGMQATCTINGKENSLKGKGNMSQLPLDFSKGLSGNFSIQNSGKGLLFVRAITRGKPPLGEEVEAHENIIADVVYRDMSDNTINPAEIIQGTNFKMVVTVRNLGAMGLIENLALNNYIPSGWEIHNARMDENESALKNSAFTYQDIRDDRVYTYFDLHTNESKTFTLLLNAAYEGKYYLPAVNIEAMYDNTVYARTKGQWIKVVKN